VSSAKRTVVILVVVLAVYLIFIGTTAVFMLTQPQLSLKLLGVAALVIPVVGVWLVVFELRFGAATARLGSQLPDDPQGDAMIDALPRRASGRIVRTATDEIFELRKAEVEAAPDSWQSWYRLAQAYDLGGDRRRAREAMRTAIEKSLPAG
jgi:hypothetical protein